MLFLSILLSILKVTGIVLLSVLGIVLLLLIIVLFVPLRYKSKIDVYNKDINFFASGSWLLHIISVSYILSEKNPLKIKIFGISLNLNKDKTVKPKKSEKPSKVKEHKKSKKKNKEEFPDNDRSQNLLVYEDINEEKKNEESKDKVIKTEISELTSNTSFAAVSKETEIESTNTVNYAPIKDDTESEEKNIAESSIDEDKKDGKNQSSYDKIKDKISIVKSDEFKEAFALSKKQIGKLLKMILPRRWYLNAKVGFNDPSTTGKILAITGMLYGFLHKHVHVVGDFENEIIDVHGKFVGHITTFKILCIAIKLYFNKNIKSIIKQFREA